MIVVFRWTSIFNDENPSCQISLEFHDSATTAKILEAIFSACQRLDAPYAHVVPDDMPSMSAGDLVSFNNKTYWCGPCAWCEISDQEALNDYNALHRRDAIFLAPVFGDNGELMSQYEADSFLSAV